MTSVTLHTSGVGDMVADSVTTDPATSNRIGSGDTATFSLRAPSTRLTVGSGETVTVGSGVSQDFDEVEVFSGGTLTVDGTLRAEVVSVDGTLNVNGTLDVTGPTPVDLSFLRDYRIYAGNATLTETLNGTQRFSETIDTAEIDTLVVGIEPSSELKQADIPGVWGVVEDVIDARNRPLSTDAVEITVSVLAPYDKYDTISDVTNNLKIYT